MGIEDLTPYSERGRMSCEWLGERQASYLQTILAQPLVPVIRTLTQMALIGRGATYNRIDDIFVLKLRRYLDAVSDGRANLFFHEVKMSVSII